MIDVGGTNIIFLERQMASIQGFNGHVAYLMLFPSPPLVVLWVVDQSRIMRSRGTFVVGSLWLTATYLRSICARTIDDDDADDEDYLALGTQQKQVRNTWENVI